MFNKQKTHATDGNPQRTRRPKGTQARGVRRNSKAAGQSGMRLRREAATHLQPCVGRYGASGLPRCDAKSDTKLAMVVLPVWAGPTMRIFMDKGRWVGFPGEPRRAGQLL